MRILLMAIIGLGYLGGCTFTVVGNAPKTEQDVAESRTVNASFLRANQFINACEDGEDIAEVRYHTNPAYLLVSLVSLGLYVPQNVTWTCGAEAPECEEGDTSEECEVWVPEEN